MSEWSYFGLQHTRQLHCRTAVAAAPSNWLQASHRGPQASTQYECGYIWSVCTLCTGWLGLLPVSWLRSGRASPRHPGARAWLRLTSPSPHSPRPGSSCSCSLERDILQTRGCGAPGLYTYTATHLDTWKTMFEDHFTVFCATFPRSHLHVVWPQDKIRLFGHHHTRQAWWQKAVSFLVAASSASARVHVSRCRVVTVLISDALVVELSHNFATQNSAQPRDPC